MSLDLNPGRYKKHFQVLLTDQFLLSNPKNVKNESFLLTKPPSSLCGGLDHIILNIHIIVRII